MKARSRAGFTIVELLMVIAIIAVLMGIVTTAASSSLKMSRSRRASTLCAIVQAGMATYYSVEDKWPITIPEVRANLEGDNYETDDDKIVLNGNEVRTCVRELVQKAKDGKPMMDISGLFVSRQQGNCNQRCYGLDFMTAIHGTRESGKKMKLAEMYFGYPETSHGYFRHFKMVYSIPADSVTVSIQDSDTRKAQRYD